MLSIPDFPLKSKQYVWKYVLTIHIHFRHIIPLNTKRRNLTVLIRDLPNLKLNDINVTHNVWCDIVLLTHLVASFHFAPLNLKNSSLYDLDKINQTSLKYFGSDLSFICWPLRKKVNHLSNQFYVQTYKVVHSSLMN